MPRHENFWNDRTTYQPTSSCDSFGAARIEFGRGCRSIGGRSPDGTSLEASLPTPRQSRVVCEDSSRPATTVDGKPASRLGATLVERRHHSRFFHRLVDLPTDQASARTGVPSQLPCRLHSVCDEIVGL